MDLNDVLDELLLNRGGRTGNRRRDLIEAGREIRERRERNTFLGTYVIDGMKNLEEMSFRDIDRETGISKSAAQRWAAPPPSEATT